MRVRKIRDLTIIDINETQSIVIACDSCGGIGTKKHDVMQIPNYYSAKFTARVVLMEIMCVGANIISISNAVCNEMEPTGREAIRGIKSELEYFKVDNAVLTGSTEENFETFTTALGVTAVGIADTEKIKINNIKDDCILISVGTPKIGGEIDLQGDKDIVSYEELINLINNENVYEIVPVGSKGILYESQLLAKNNNMNLILNEEINIDINRSSGPATSIVVALKEEEYKNITNINNINVLGTLVKR